MMLKSVKTSCTKISLDTYQQIAFDIPGKGYAIIIITIYFGYIGLMAIQNAIGISAS